MNRECNMHNRDENFIQSENSFNRLSARLYALVILRFGMEICSE